MLIVYFNYDSKDTFYNEENKKDRNNIYADVIAILLN